MGLWWITLIGLVVIMLIAGGTIMHFLSQALNTEDANRVDKINNNDSNQS
ncbi:hypothetical protein [Neobacillus kokaensis]|uniref:YtzI protein n=1 Tax=Neobacillus kokaensis TaxID=2759023 RepID=A0ABQ3N943_9BACI|nr:hypothetical protein [Neobacillus kokaensis]GHI00253.1 hypothetical protein AM1BK_37950 [Neobacillus kokaensis]